MKNLFFVQDGWYSNRVSDFDYVPHGGLIFLIVGMRRFLPKPIPSIIKSSRRKIAV